MSNLTIDIASLCNLKCEFCYQTLDGFLSADEVFRLIASGEFDRIEIGGGEPFLHLEIMDIIRGLRERGKRINISTNATIIPQGFLESAPELRESLDVQLSLHASNPELYQRITGKDLFDVAIGNIRKIKEAYAAFISSSIYQENYHDVPNLLDLAQELKLPIRINLVVPIGRGKNVRLLVGSQARELRDYLLVEKIKRREIDSPLIHPNNCPVLESFYGLESDNECAVNSGNKQYVTLRGEFKKCEFLEEA